ncbi:MAG TPA: aspartate--tRNA(Asn) ligase [Patescibacteria group bacterium]|nr:aspartate--tRNA(Asn) ligase [Patescibacteria group bacterium]
MICHVSELNKLVEKKVTIRGFTQTLRKQSNIIFVIVRDINGEVQVVIEKEKKELFELFNNCTNETVVEITGTVKKRPGGDNQVEVNALEAKILSVSDGELPIPVVLKTNDETDIQKRLDWRWIDLRKPKNANIFKIWTVMENSFREYWVNNGYIQVYSPKLMSTPSESGAELFAVPYFDTTAYLAQSPQFYKQMAMSSGFEKVFELGPVFRADPSFTSRHATEFTGLDSEISYIETHHDVMSEKAKLMNYVLSKLKDSHGKLIKELYGRELIVPKLPFPSISFSDAKKTLAKLGVKSDRDNDFSPEEEKAISKYILDKENHEFVFVYDFPFAGRAFYSMRYDDKPTISKSFDLFWNGLEITSGAQREHRYDELLKNMKIKKINLDHMQSYLNFFKYGCPPHGGYGTGPARLLMKTLNISNIRDVTYVYRGVNRLEP